MIELPTLNGRRFVRGWARTLQGQQTLEELLDLGYLLAPPPVAGGARNFSSNSISKADDALLDVVDGDSLIVQCLFKLDAVGTVVRVIAGKKNSTTGTVVGYRLVMGAGEAVFFNCADGTNALNSNNTAVIDAGTWYAMTAYLQANAANDDDVNIYVEDTPGTEVNSTVLGSLANADEFVAGARNSTNASAWDGDIAYCRLWKMTGAWTTAQLNQVVEARNRLYLPAGWGPGTQILQWILWDTAASPSTTRDWSGNGMTGTYSGTVFVDDPARVVGPGGSPYKFGKAAAVAVKHRRTLLGVGV